VLEFFIYSNNAHYLPNMYVQHNFLVAGLYCVGWCLLPSHLFPFHGCLLHLPFCLPDLIMNYLCATVVPLVLPAGGMDTCSDFYCVPCDSAGVLPSACCLLPSCLHAGITPFWKCYCLLLYIQVFCYHCLLTDTPSPVCLPS